MPVGSVRAALEAAFTRWGPPAALRVDNGLPLGSPGSDVPPVLSLWLIGIGVDVIWNRVRRPTDNAKVERMQAVTADWAEPGRCAGPAVLERRLAEAVRVQREAYPVRRLDGRTRLEAFPALAERRRRYDGSAFDLGLVLRFLARGQWVRRVNAAGQVDFFGRRFSLGRGHARTQVSLRLEEPGGAAPAVWVARDDQGREVGRLSASFLTAERICGLSLTG